MGTVVPTLINAQKYRPRILEEQKKHGGGVYRVYTRTHPTIHLQSSIMGRPFLFAGHLERTRFRLHFLTRDLAPLLLSDEDSFMAVGFGAWGFRFGGGEL